MKFVYVPGGIPRARLLALRSWLSKISVCLQHESRNNYLVEDPTDIVRVGSVGMLLCRVYWHEFVIGGDFKVEGCLLVDIDAVDACLRSTIRFSVLRCRIIPEGRQMVGVSEPRGH